MNTILLTISMSLMYASPLIFGALGGLVTQRSGVDNLGVEGMMAFGAFCGAMVGYYSNNPWLGFLAAGLGGVLLALLHGVVAINFNGNQTISGIAINFIGPGLALFLTRIFFDGAAQSNTITNKLPKVSRLFGIDVTQNRYLQAADVDITVVLALLTTLIIWFVLYRTAAGLRVRACGEHPAAADTLGINVQKVRYTCVILSGLLAGFGGGTFTLAIVSNYTQTVISGQGFIALAAIIFGNWKPLQTTAACLLFGFAQALVILLANVQAVPSQILNMLPYVLTLVVLVFVGKSEPPKANGKPYIKGSR